MTSARHKAPVFRLEPNKARILETLVFLISEADKRKISLTQYIIVKCLFLADRKHLNDYGRPITFDNYVAMNHGPAPSTAYDALKSDDNTKRILGLTQVPWSRRPSTEPEHGKNANIYFQAKRKADMKTLSESDVEALSAALTIVSSLDFNQIRKLTHDDPAYRDAWEDIGARKSYPMSYGLLFESPD